MDNYEIADNFSLLSKLMDIHGENSFKSKSYSIAAFNIEKLPVQLSGITEEKIASLQGIGDTIAKKIIELLHTGKIISLENLLANTPSGILEMLQIKGIGPKKISTIWKQMEIENIGELLYACHENRLLLYKGFGEKTQQNVKEAIEFFLKNQGTFLYAQVEDAAAKLKELLNGLFHSEKVEITGAFRRQMETIDQLEYVILSTADEIKSALAKTDQFELQLENEEGLLFKFNGEIRVMIYPADSSDYYATLFKTSASPEFMATFSEEFPGFNNATSEEDIFESSNLQFIPPCLRETPAILQQAKKRSIPALIQPGDIKGIIHSHSNWSDGSQTPEQMVKAAIEQGLEYLVLSDHSKTAFYANGLNEEKISAQHKLIDELNERYKPFRVFKSIESDILGDGSLDYPEPVLASFDLVIASVHANLKMSEEKAMARLLAAIENPYTTILGHMTGRLLLSRNGFPVDHFKIIDACAANNVVIELNAHPRRLDMRWQWIPYALEKNIIISIDPDAHSVAEYGNTKYGVLSAQKGMLTKENNLSSFSLEEFELFLKKRKDGKPT